MRCEKGQTNGFERRFCCRRFTPVIKGDLHKGDNSKGKNNNSLRRSIVLRKYMREVIGRSMYDMVFGFRARVGGTLFVRGSCLHTNTIGAHARPIPALDNKSSPQRKLKSGTPCMHFFHSLINSSFNSCRCLPDFRSNHLGETAATSDTRFFFPSCQTCCQSRPKRRSQQQAEK